MTLRSIRYARYRSIAALFAILLPAICWSQRIEPPDWVYSIPKSESGWYSYFPGSATVSNDENRAFVSAIMASFEKAAIFSNSVEVSTEIEEMLSTTGIEGMRNTRLSSLPHKIQNAALVDYYVEEKGSRKYRVHTLIRIPKDPNAPFDPPQPEYGPGPVLKSIILPGWGQSTKGQEKKGKMLLISTLGSGMISGITLYFAQEMKDKSGGERRAEIRENYKSFGNFLFTVGIGSAVTAGFLYIYNVFDSIASKGKQRYAATPNNIFGLRNGIA